MVETGTGANNIFRQVEQIQLADIYHQTYEYFGQTFIVNVLNVLPNPLVVPDIIILSTSEQEVQKLYDKVSSDMIVKPIAG